MTLPCAADFRLSFSEVLLPSGLVFDWLPELAKGSLLLVRGCVAGVEVE